MLIFNRLQPFDNFYFIITYFDRKINNKSRLLADFYCIYYSLRKNVTYRNFS